MRNYLGKWASTEGAVLIFDDLERVAMGMEDIWGYINQFVEHEGYRVIVIANEEKYVARAPGFHTVKEKVVGRTFDIRAEAGPALDHFLKEAEKDGAHPILFTRRHLILEVFNRASYGNLRQLRQAVADFADLWSCLSIGGLSGKTDFLDRLVQDVFSIGIEYRAGTIVAADINSAGRPVSSLTRLMSHVKGQEPPPPTPAEMAFERHDLRWPSKLALSPDAYSSYFAYGYLDSTDAKEALSRSPYLINEHTPSWQKLWHKCKLSDADFSYCLDDVYLRFTNCDYKVEGEFLHVAGLLIDFAKSGLHRHSPNKMENLAKKVVRKLARMDLIDIGPIHGEERHSLADMSAYGLRFMAEDTQEFKEVVRFYREYKQLARKKQMRKWATEWMAELTSNPV